MLLPRFNISQHGHAYSVREQGETVAVCHTSEDATRILSLLAEDYVARTVSEVIDTQQGC